MFCLLAFLAHYVAWRHFWRVLLGSPIQNERWPGHPETDMPERTPVGWLVEVDGNKRTETPVYSWLVDTSGNGSR